MKSVQLQHDGLVLRVLLDRPEKHNAFNDAMIEEMISAFEAVSTKDDVRVVVIESTGKHFCAGGDLKWMQRSIEFTDEENILDANRLAKLFNVIDELELPVVAIVSGAAYGGALGILSCCDVVLASSESSFCFSEVKLGLVAATIAPYVTRAIGVRAASRYFLTAEDFDTTAAKAINLVHEVCDADGLDQKADEIISRLLQNGPQAMAATKALLRQLYPIDEKIISDTADLIAKTRASTEAQQGLTAFFNKQLPEWVS